MVYDDLPFNIPCHTVLTEGLISIRQPIDPKHDVDCVYQWYSNSSSFVMSKVFKWSTRRINEVINEYSLVNSRRPGIIIEAEWKQQGLGDLSEFLMGTLGVKFVGECTIHLVGNYLRVFIPYVNSWTFTHSFLFIRKMRQVGAIGAYQVGINSKSFQTISRYNSLRMNFFQRIPVWFIQ